MAGSFSPELFISYLFFFVFPVFLGLGTTIRARRVWPCLAEDPFRIEQKGYGTRVETKRKNTEQVCLNFGYITA